MDIKNQIFYGDSADILTKYPSNSVDLIVTSPPYSNRRKRSYGGISPDRYVEWFLPISKELYRILKQDGSFVLNIKEGANGEREIYVLELILALRKQGWYWTEEYIWYKTTCMPGKWPNRFRDAWERCLQFTKGRKFRMNQRAVKIPIGNWAKKRMKNLSENDTVRTASATNSGFGRKVENWANKRTVYPDNVLKIAPVCKNHNHSAVYPKELPAWFIKLFSKRGGIVLDPFIGSGTTAIAAVELDRHYSGVELNKTYYQIAKKNVQNALHTKAASISTIKAPR
ncbi:MAG: site-specific DNA-methyltransferase [Candidatus Micrarchaeota archaeon]|nr:site-specific DNA-methyltransferase [Candidatus Micrarchaeota archaeon]